MRKMSPYRTLGPRCEERSLSGERCVRPVGHDGMHVLDDGSAWVRAGDAGNYYHPGGAFEATAGDNGKEDSR